MLAERVPIVRLPHTCKATPSDEHDRLDSRTIAQHWISNLDDVLASKDASRLDSLMHQDCWWRDLLVFEWDFHTTNGLDKVIKYVSRNIHRSTPRNFKLQQSGKFAPTYSNPVEGLEWIESMFSFDTQIGRGSGMLRLVQDADGTWKCYALYTALTELQGFEEKAGTRRGHGGNNSLLADGINGNWHERRQREIEFLDREPQAMIIGAGQAGLNLGARLQALGISCVIVDKNARIGDNWRQRYRVNRYYCATRHLAKADRPSDPRHA